MKRVLSIILLILCFSNIVFASEIGLDNIQKQQIKYTPKVDKETKDLTIDKDTALKGIISLQQEKDVEDLELLWQATVDNNNIIKFAMKKLSIPPEQQRYHSSLMAKSVSALISGASFVPSLFGANYMLQSASYATGRLANNYLSKNNNPQEVPLTDTELIELAGMIESLQDQVINLYYNYKMSLTQVKDTRQRLVIYNQNYAQAIKNNNKMEIVVSSGMYDDLLFEEFQQMREARKYQLELERLAGKKTVEKLNLYQYAFKNELFNQKLIQSEKSISNNGGEHVKK